MNIQKLGFKIHLATAVAILGTLLTRATSVYSILDKEKLTDYEKIFIESRDSNFYNFTGIRNQNITSIRIKIEIERCHK